MGGDHGCIVAIQGTKVALAAPGNEKIAELLLVGQEDEIKGALKAAHCKDPRIRIVHASQVFSGGLYQASEAERERAKTLGMVNGFAIDYDLDRDGHADTIAVYVRQVPVIIEVVDKGKDGIVHWADFVIKSTDFVVLSMPEIAGLPFVITGLVMAGGLAAALSTADGLLLTIANFCRHTVTIIIKSVDSSSFPACFRGCWGVTAGRSDPPHVRHGVTGRAVLVGSGTSTRAPRIA